MTHDRHNRIRELLAHHGRVGVAELARRFRVTPMTVRRDLATMEKAGLLTRTHGGGVPRSSFARELPFAEKSRLHTARKLAIAREVVRRIPARSSIYLDTGTTAVEVARALPPTLPLRVFPNNLSVAMELFGRAGVEVVVYGGTLASKSPDLVGEIALSRIDDFRLDAAVIGADALDAAQGTFYSADAATAMLSRLVQKQVERTFVVADSSKFGKRSLALAGRLRSGTTLFTDADAPPRDRAAVRRTGAEIVCVNGGKAKPKKARSVRSRRKEKRHGKVRSKKVRR